jgi:HlyD family secretion protein
MNRAVVFKRVILILLILGALGGGIYAYRRHNPVTSNVLTLFGNVDIRQVQLAFQDTGRIVRVLANEGDHVKAGQVLAELDPVRYSSAMARAEAQVALQREVLARLEAGSRPQEIAEVQARVRAAEALLKDADQRKARTWQLAENQFVSRQLLDDTATAVETAAANLDALRKTAELVVQGPRKEDIAAARAQLQANQATLELARHELTDTRLIAPTNGVVQNRILEAGDMAFPQTPVFTLALTDPVWVRAYISEPDLGKIAEGMAATVTTDSFPGKGYAGWIGFISPTSEFTPKQVETSDLRTRLVYQIRVYVPNPDNQLRLGMPATVSIALDHPRGPGPVSSGKD